ncbi:hypothetical protein GAY28_00295 [Azospirillum brasilense]|nr:hypothetical protein [Azospirillum brasilense]
MTATQTYTIAYTNDPLFLAVVPTGSDIETALRKESESVGCEFTGVRIAHDIILTNDAPEAKADWDRVVFSGGATQAPDGTPYEYAMRA